MAWQLANYDLTTGSGIQTLVPQITGSHKFELWYATNELPSELPERIKKMVAKVFQNSPIEKSSQIWLH